MKLDDAYASPELVRKFIQAGTLKLATPLPLSDRPPSSDHRAYMAWYRKRNKERILLGKPGATAPDSANALESIG